MNNPIRTFLVLCIILTTFLAMPCDAQSAQNASQNAIGHFADTQTGFGEGTIKLSNETQRLLSDREYRESIYAQEYNLAEVQSCLVGKRLTQALWTLINLHQIEPDMAALVVHNLSRLGVRSELYINAFYTYAMADPEIFSFGPGEPYIRNPEILEAKLASCRVLCAYADQLAPASDSMN